MNDKHHSQIDQPTPYPNGALCASVECSAKRISLVPHLHRVGVSTESFGGYAHAAANAEGFYPEAVNAPGFHEWFVRFLMRYANASGEVWMQNQVAQISDEWREAMVFMMKQWMTKADK